MPLDIINTILIAIYGFLKVYESFFLTPTPLLEYLLRLFLFYWFLQIILDSFRFLKNLIYQLCFPFRWLHVFLHAQAAKKISLEVEKIKEEDRDNYNNTLDKTTLRASLISGVDRSDENPGLILGVNRVEYARRIAYAPLKTGLVMAAGFVMVTLLIWFLNYTADLATLVIHFYFYIGIFVVLMPSRNDWYFYIHAAMISLNIRQRWVHWSMVVYFVSMIEVFLRTQDFLLALLVGMVAFHFYLVAIFSVAMVAMGRHGSSSRLFFFPSPRPAFLPKGADLDIQNLGIEDLDV